MECPPIEPHASIVPYEPTAIRTFEVFGTVVELALVPKRRARSGQIGEHRPPLRLSPASRILREEAYWRSNGIALTPNKYPFARHQRILWMDNPAREPDFSFWQTTLAWVEASNGTALLNNIGAAATIPRAHAHLIGEKMPFLPSLPERELKTELIDLPRGCELHCKDVPFCIIGVRGELEAKATALMLLADARLTASWNVVVTKEAAWVTPRIQQVPAPFFPEALGAAEIWGRWCYSEREPFEQASPAGLERALSMAIAAAID